MQRRPLTACGTPPCTWAPWEGARTAAQVKLPLSVLFIGATYAMFQVVQMPVDLLRAPNKHVEALCHDFALWRANKIAITANVLLRALPTAFEGGLGLSFQGLYLQSDTL